MRREGGRDEFPCAESKGGPWAKQQVGWVSSAAGCVAFVMPLYCLRSAVLCCAVLCVCLPACLQEDFEMAVAKVMKKDSDRNMSLKKLWK